MSQELVLDRNLEDAKQFARLLYLAHGLTFFFSLGLLSFLPLIVNYVKPEWRSRQELAFPDRRVLA